MDTSYFTMISTLVVGVLAGAIVALKFIAPKTKTTVDDTVLARLEAVESFIEGLLPGASAPPAPAPEPPKA